MKPVVLHLWEPVFQINFYILYGVPADRLDKHYREKFFDSNLSETREQAQGRTICNWHDDGTIMIWLWTRDRRPDVLAHECVHAAHFALAHKDIPLSDDSVEVYCYLVQWLMSGALDNKTRRKTKG